MCTAIQTHFIVLKILNLSNSFIKCANLQLIHKKGNGDIYNMKFKWKFQKKNIFVNILKILFYKIWYILLFCITSYRDNYVILLTKNVWHIWSSLMADKRTGSKSLKVTATRTQITNQNRTDTSQIPSS